MVKVSKVVQYLSTCTVHMCVCGKLTFK